MSLHIALVTVRHTLVIVRHPLYVLVVLETTWAITPISVIVTDGCNNAFNLMLITLYFYCEAQCILTLDHALWSEWLDKVQLTTISD